jgi:hypothetical protein
MAKGQGGLGKYASMRYQNSSISWVVIYNTDIPGYNPACREDEDIVRPSPQLFHTQPFEAWTTECLHAT